MRGGFRQPNGRNQRSPIRFAGARVQRVSILRSSVFFVRHREHVAVTRIDVNFLHTGLSRDAQIEVQIKHP